MMATNILARDFKISMKDLNCIDVSPDRQVKRAFIRLELVPKNSKIEELMYCARALNPNYPGVLDYGCWKIGKKVINPKTLNANNAIYTAVSSPDTLLTSHECSRKLKSNNRLATKTTKNKTAGVKPAKQSQKQVHLTDNKTTILTDKIT